MRKSISSFVAVVLVTAACSGGGTSYGSPTGTNSNPAPTTPNTVDANPANTYNPTSLTVSKGTSVTFNFGSVGHSVTFTTRGAPANIPVVSNTTASVTFPNAGTFNYYCTVHPGMVGAITVQ